MESFYDQTFENIDYSQDGFPDGEYESCTFKNCLFNAVNLSHRVFMECEFVDCDFSGVKLGDTAFKDVKFIGCKLQGVDFSSCNPFLLEMNFDKCLMNLASFYQLKLKGTIFKECSLEEADFVETDLSESKFLDCKLTKAQFDNTNLEKADLRTAVHFSINPINNKITKARFSREGLIGLLDQFDIRVG